MPYSWLGRLTEPSIVSLGVEEREEEQLLPFVLSPKGYRGVVGTFNLLPADMACHTH